MIHSRKKPQKAQEAQKIRAEFSYFVLLVPFVVSSSSLQFGVVNIANHHQKWYDFAEPNGGFNDAIRKILLACRCSVSRLPVIRAAGTRSRKGVRDSARYTV